MVIEIINTGKWFAAAAKDKKPSPQTNGMRVGLENVKKRLQRGREKLLDCMRGKLAPEGA